MSAISADIVWRPADNSSADHAHIEDSGPSRENPPTYVKIGSKTAPMHSTTSIKKQRSELFRTFKERQSKRGPAPSSSTSFSTRHPTVPSSSATKDNDVGHDASLGETKVAAPFESLSPAQLHGDDVEMSGVPETASKAEAQFMLEQLDRVMHGKTTSR